MRNMKLLTLLTVALVGLVFLSVGALTAAEKKAPVVPDKILINEKAFEPKKKGPVEFNHKEHAIEHKIACTECHHVYKDGKNVWKEGDPVQKCSACHDPVKTEGKKYKLNLAFHKNCKDCHKKYYKKGEPEKAPYRKCNGCHEKK